MKDEIERQVTAMLQPELIQPSTSKFSSSILLVKKKDNTWRFCDFRHLMICRGRLGLCSGDRSKAWDWGRDLSGYGDRPEMELISSAGARCARMTKEAPPAR
jgi:hypothetical protein